MATVVAAASAATEAGVAVALVRAVRAVRAVKAARGVSNPKRLQHVRHVSHVKPRSRATDVNRGVAEATDGKGIAPRARVQSAPPSSMRCRVCRSPHRR
jgi:hypothetical protein